jgi:hypothetical protein
MPMVPEFDGYVETTGQGIQHLPGQHLRSQPLLGAVRTGGPESQPALYPERIDFVAHDTQGASHPRSFDRKQVLYDWQHYIPLIERKPGALRNGAPFADMPEPLQRCAACCSSAKGVIG